jgi:hypothetical protein
MPVKIRDAESLAPISLTLGAGGGLAADMTLQRAAYFALIWLCTERCPCVS